MLCFDGIVCCTKWTKCIFVILSSYENSFDLNLRLFYIQYISVMLSMMLINAIFTLNGKSICNKHSCLITSHNIICVSVLCLLMDALLDFVQQTGD